jgi:hypothetical protein
MKTAEEANNLSLRLCEKYRLNLSEITSEVLKNTKKGVVESTDK